MNVAGINLAPTTHWHSNGAFVCAALGAGFGSFFRLPIVIQHYGAANFLYPYLLCMLVVGIPVLILEVALGQIYHKGCLHTLDKVCYH